MFGVRDERYGHHKHLVHMFGSAAIGTPNLFTAVPNEIEIPLDQLNPKHVTLSTKEYSVVQKDCISIIAEPISK